MANYNLVIGSEFLPFSFERYIQPYVMVDKEYRDILDLYSELATLADVWSNVADGTEGTLVQNLYNKYTQDLSNYADLLSKYGLTPLSRRDMLNMKRRYAKEIVPIEKAFKKREEDIKRQKATLDSSKGRTVFSRNAATTSLDAYMGNLEDYQLANLDTIMLEGMMGAKAISSRYFDTKEGKVFNNDYLILTKVQGIPEDVAINELIASGKYPQLNEFVNNELHKVGAVKGKSSYAEYDRSKILDALMLGINMGIVYEKTPQLVENWQRKLAVQDWYNRKNDTPDPTDPPVDDTLYYRPIPKTTVNGDTYTSEILKDIDFIQSILNDPKQLLKYTKPTKVQSPTLSPTTGIPIIVDIPGGYEAQEKLVKILKNYGIDAKYTVKDDGTLTGDLDKAIPILLKKIEDTAIRMSDYKLNLADNTVLNDYISLNITTFSLNGHSGIYELEEGYKGDEISVDDALKYINTNTSIDYDPDIGFKLSTKDDKNKPVNLVIDMELIDDPYRTFAGTHYDIQKAIKENRNNDAKFLIKNLMKALYYRVNTLAKRLSTSNSNI